MIEIYVLGTKIIDTEKNFTRAVLENTDLNMLLQYNYYYTLLYNTSGVSMSTCKTNEL